MNVARKSENRIFVREMRVAGKVNFIIWQIMDYLKAMFDGNLDSSIV